MVEGEAEITISGKPHHVKGGELILMPAQQPHALKALQRFKMILTMIRSWVPPKGTRGTTAPAMRQRRMGKAGRLGRAVTFACFNPLHTITCHTHKPLIINGFYRFNRFFTLSPRVEVPK